MIETSTTAPLPRPAVKRRRLGRALAFLVAATGTVLSVLWYIGVFGGNFHAVVPGRVYRSAQLTGHNLDEALQISHAKTVINLRGGSPSDAWYQSELASCRQAGAKHIDITMSARRLPDPRSGTIKRTPQRGQSPNRRIVSRALALLVVAGVPSLNLAAAADTAACAAS